MTHTRREKGQAILLIALAAVALIAATGLAIDGGRLMYLHRETQNAADAAAIASARALCQGRDYVQSGLAAADVNGYDNNTETNWVSVISPPTNVSIANPDECGGCYVEVSVRAEIDPAFIAIVYDGPMDTTSRAIGVCSPDITGGATASDLRALWAMGTSCPNASVSVTGSTIEIIGGVHSNGTLQVNAGGGDHVGQVVGPSSYVTSVKNEKKVDWLVGEGGTISIVTPTGVCNSGCFNDLGGFGTGGYPDVNPYQTEVQDEWPVDYDIEDYRPGGAKAEAAGENYYVYPCKGPNDAMDSNWLVDQGLLRDDNTLADGIYYSECDIHTGHGGQGWDDLTGNVTFIAEGEIHIDGARHHLNPYVDDLLAFSYDDKKGIHFSGTSNHWSGNIFVPNGEFQTSGSSNNATDGCVIAECINFSGSNNRLNCQPSDVAGTPGIWLSE